MKFRKMAVVLCISWAMKPGYQVGHSLAVEEEVAGSQAAAAL